MATAEGEAGLAPSMHGGSEAQRTLIESWRRLGRAATVVALLSSLAELIDAKQVLPDVSTDLWRHALVEDRLADGRLKVLVE